MVDLNADSDIRVKWNDHHTSFFSNTASLLRSSVLTDVILSCSDGVELEAHKLVLIAGSRYFNSIFTGKQRSKQQSPLMLSLTSRPTIVFLKDIHSHHMKLLLAYMYQGEITLHEDDLVSLLSVAEALQVTGLKSSCESNGSKTTARTQKRSLFPSSSENTRSYPAIKKERIDERSNSHDDISTTHANETLTSSVSTESQPSSSSSSTRVNRSSTSNAFVNRSTNKSVVSNDDTIDQDEDGALATDPLDVDPDEEEEEEDCEDEEDDMDEGGDDDLFGGRGGSSKGKSFKSLRSSNGGGETSFGDGESRNVKEENNTSTNDDVLLYEEASEDEDDVDHELSSNNALVDPKMLVLGSPFTKNKGKKDSLQSTAEPLSIQFVKTHRGCEQLMCLGYTYTVNQTTRKPGEGGPDGSSAGISTSYWRCAVRRPSCKGRFITCDGKAVTSVPPVHSHPPDQVHQEVEITYAAIRDACLARGEMSKESIHEIVTQALDGMAYEVAMAMPPINSIVKRIGRAYKREKTRCRSEDPSVEWPVV